jgi:ABC-type nickel/cobalt efflux system permease component RcnA
VSFCMRTYLRERHVRLVAARLCITCEAKHSGKHVRCDGCHEAHVQDSRQRYQSRGTGFTCGACGGEGHNRRTCEIARAA